MSNGIFHPFARCGLWLCSTWCCVLLGIVLLLLAFGAIAFGSWDVIRNDGTKIETTAPNNNTVSSTSILSTMSTSTMNTTTVTAPSSILNNTCTSSWNGPMTVLVYLSNSAAFSYTFFQYSFVATATNTTMALALRHDPSYWCLDDISVFGNGQQLWQNGGFEMSPLTQYYTYCNPNSASSSGVISTSCVHSGNYSFYDGSVTYSDYLSQSFTTVVGASYNISFWLANQGGPINSFTAIISS